MIEAASRLPYPLLVAGDGPLAEQLKAKYASCSNIHFLGRLNAAEVSQLLSTNYASIMPSECYENNPLGVIESLCAGTPVIGAKIGGIPELIDEGINGATFQSKNALYLQSAIEKVFNKQFNNSSIAHDAIDKYSPQKHLSSILKCYGND